jgi:hypothetical protein
MIEDDVFKDDFFVEVFPFMTSALEAAQVIDLGVWPGNYFTGNKIDEGYLAVSPLSYQMIPESRLVVARKARNVLMGSGLP